MEGIFVETELAKVKLNVPVKVLCIDESVELQRRLRDFGFVPGTEVVCRYRSPGGFVTALEFRDTVIAMRKCDLKKIQVLC